MRVNGDGVLAIWHGVASGGEDDVRAWYDREHHFERLAVPGFLRARRYEAEAGGPAIFSRYDTRDVGVLSSPEYLARLDDPTPWTRRVQPQVRDYARAVCVRRWRIGAAAGGYAVTVRMAALVASPDLRSVAERLVREAGVLGCEIIEADGARSAIPTREAALRETPVMPVASALIVEATDRAAADKAARGATASLPVGASVTVYRLAFFAEGAAERGA